MGVGGTVGIVGWVGGMRMGVGRGNGMDGKGMGGSGRVWGQRAPPPGLEKTPVITHLASSHLD